MERDDVIHELIDIQYDRNDYEQKRGTFRVRGDALDVFPPYADHPIRVEFWGDEIESIDEIDHVTGEVLKNTRRCPSGRLPTTLRRGRKWTRPSARFRTSCESGSAVQGGGQAPGSPALGDARTTTWRCWRPWDLLRHRELLAPSGRAVRRASRPHPHRLLPEGLPLHHRRVPRHGAADPRHARGRPLRKITLAEHGFRLPSAAFDNRPLRFDEFEERVPQFVYVSATPGEYEERGSQHGRAGHPPDGPAGPGDRRAH